MDRKAEFLKVYANLPLGLREEIVVIVDGKPMTWNAAYVEVENDTDKSKEILDKLVHSGILK